MKDVRKFIPLLKSKVDPVEYGVYPLSIHTSDETTVFITRIRGEKHIVSVGPSIGLEGISERIEDKEVIIGELNSANAAVLREVFPFTAPSRVLSKERSIGCGDRLGLASAGHTRVFTEYDAYPILAQQSMRELNLTRRTYQQVLDAATFAVFQEGYKKGWGADGDHLKTSEEIQHALSVGYTMITLDCSEHMNNEFELMDTAELEARYVPDVQVEKEYIGKEIVLSGGVSFSYSEEEVKRMVMTYRDVLTHAQNIYDTFFKDGTYDADFEISIDETTTTTTVQEHYFVANELIKRGVSFATIAPRFCGEFQKGVDYIGNVEDFERDLIVHQAIASHFGYKLSLHSGSDKFSVFEIFGRITNGRFHVKTAGTNWLEAMKLVAVKAPELYRRVHAYALSKFDEVTQYYHVSTDITRIPDLQSLSDAELVKLFDHNDSRQLIHITYGPILTDTDAGGNPLFADDLFELWDEYEEDYAHLLFTHISRHLYELYRHINQ